MSFSILSYLEWFSVQSVYIHCPMKGPNIMKRKENRISIEKLAVMELETLSETDSLLVNLYIRE